MLLLNKTQEEYNLTAFNAMVGLDVIDVKRLKSINVMLQADHILDSSNGWHSGIRDF